MVVVGVDLHNFDLWRWSIYDNHNIHMVGGGDTQMYIGLPFPSNSLSTMLTPGHFLSPPLGFPWAFPWPCSQLNC